MRTTNGGFAWIQVYFGLGQSNIDVYFQSVDTAFATGSKVLLRSTNSGANWTIMVNGNAGTGFYGLQFLNSTTGYIAGYTSYGMYSSTKLIRTFDGCLTLDTFNFGYSRINFSDQNKGIAFNVLGKPVKTTTGGISWTSFDFNGISNTFNGAFNVSQNVACFVGDFGAIIKADNVITNINNTEYINADNFLLQQNYPNPFNPKTIINYAIPSNVKRQTSDVKLIIYNSLGKQITTLVNRKQNAGSYSVEFNGEGLPSGIYFYKIEAGDFTETKRMVLLK
ncbi:MAG: T9SS type A sorting domain-containing protein [Ignavibacteria bacterium]|nr:T9SS type A sorting domain-containing protein [Ignavibacteria bacterium]